MRSLMRVLNRSHHSKKMRVRRMARMEGGPEIPLPRQSQVQRLDFASLSCMIVNHCKVAMPGNVMLK